MLLFPVSVKADPIVKSFAIPNNGWNTSTSSQEACAGNISNQNNIINSGDFYWSGVYYSAAQRDDDAWTGIAKNTKCCSRQEVTFSASSYTISVITKWKGEEKTVNLPKIIINGNDYYVTRVVENSESQSFSNNQWGYARDNSTWQSKEATLEYDVNLSSGGGNYTISLQTADDGNGGYGGDKDKYLFKTLTITPNCTQHTVTVAADDNNKGTVAGGGSYCEYSEVTVTATPKPGYNFVNWTNNNNSNAEVSTNASYTFTLTANVSYRANFAACEGATVTVNVNDEDMGSATGGGSYCAGVQVDLEATPKSGYRFVNWTVSGSASLDNVNNASTHFTMFNPAAAVTVQANFEVNPCTNTKTIQCEDYVAYSTQPIGSKDNKPSGLIREAHTGHGAPKGGYYADFKTSTGEMWIPITLPAGTFTFTVRYVKGGDNMWFNLYDVANSSKIDNSKKMANKGDYWDTDESNSYTLSGGDYVIGIFCNAQYTGLDQITITATSNVFCPTYDITMVNNMGGEAPTADKVKAEENASVSISAAATIGEFSFTGWSASPLVEFENASAANTTFTMPAEAVTITANYNTYSRTGAPIAAGNYGTICLPLNGKVTGATLYSVVGKETGYLVLEDKGTSLEAGKPYIFQLSANELRVALDGTYTDLQDGNGLEGTYELINLTPYDDTHHNYFLYANAFKKAGDNVTVGAYRAYLNWDAVGAPAQAPSARRIRMVIEGKEVQTGMETVTAMPKTTKVLIDGQLFIIREGKRYTLTGARAQ